MLEVTKTQWSKIQAMAIARAFSMLGSELTLFTLVFREKEQGPAAVAALFIAGTLPMIIFSPWAGTIADRFSTKQVIPIFSLIGGAAVFCQTQHLATWLILTLLFISNTCASVVAPTWGKLTPTLATKDDIGRAMGTIQTYFSMAMLLGPFVAGLLVSKTGFIATFVIDGIFTTLIAFMPFILKVNHKPEAKEEGEKTKVTEGFIFIFRNKFLRALVIMVFGVVLCMSVINVGDVFLLTNIMKADALIYGLVGGCFAVGTLVCSLIIGARKASPRAELLLLGIGTAVLSLSGLAVGLAPNYWFVMVVWFIAGSANATINTYGVGMMIKAIPHEVQGRAFAAFNAIISIASIGSMSVAGLVIGVFGVREVFITAGILSAISYVILYPTVHIEQSKVIAQEA
jgi:MFS family permease